MSRTTNVVELVSVSAPVQVGSALVALAVIVFTASPVMPTTLIEVLVTSAVGVVSAEMSTSAGTVINHRITMEKLSTKQ